MQGLLQNLPINCSKLWNLKDYIDIVCLGKIHFTISSGFLSSIDRELRKPHGNVYFAGTELALKWTGYMDGAVEAGERAAREVLHQLGKISADKIWQEEPPSKVWNKKYNKIAESTTISFRDQQVCNRRFCICTCPPHFSICTSLNL